MKKIRYWSVAVGFYWMASLAYANSLTSSDELFELSLDQLMQLEVKIATGTQKTLSKAPASVTVITQDDIQKTGATNIAEILESVPGVHVRFNRASYSPFIHIRGTNTNQVLLMVNGISMRSLTSAWPQDFFWKGMPVSAVERVEVIRGPGSALYGANASAGVVNIITKSAGSIQQNEVGARVGSFDTRSIWGQQGTNVAGMDIGMSFDISQTDGHSPYIVADRAGTAGTVSLGYKNLDLRSYMTRDDWRIQADYTKNSDVEVGFDGSGYFDPLTKGSVERVHVGGFYNNPNIAPNWGVDAELRYQDLSSSSGDGYRQEPPCQEPPCQEPPTGGADVTGKIDQQLSSERHINIEVSGLFTGFQDHEMRIGGGHKWLNLYEVQNLVNYDASGTVIGDGTSLTNISGTSRAFALESTRKLKYLFLQDIWTLSDSVELTAGARFDDYSDFGNTLNPRLALVWNTTDKLTTKLMYGEAYRAPSFVEIKNTTTSVLAPETSKTVELGFTYPVSDQLLFAMNLFKYEMEGIIKWSSGQYQNGSEFGVNGIELEAQWQPRDDLRIFGNFTVRNPDDNTERNDYEPYKDAYLRLDWRFKPAWSWNIQTNWIAERNRSTSNDNTDDKIGGTTYDNLVRPDLDDNFLMNSTVRYHYSNQWEFAASVRNLLDDDAFESTGRTIPFDLPLPKRNLFIEARYKF